MVMASSVILSGAPMGALAAFIEPFAAPMLTAAPALMATPLIAIGIAEAAEVTWPEAATEWAALPTVLALACPDC